MKTTADIRSSFIDFFAERGHRVVKSSPLVPANDPTLLFTNAGMVQFKDVFLGAESRDYSRATSSQRCVRAGGKHNDLENVGYTARHHTFFEMLGNFSFGDYFKREAIEYAWQYLTEVCGLPPEKLWVTIFEEDDEAAEIWLNEIGVDPKRFSRIGAKDNFWAMGDTGPCGPCTEIFYDHGPDVPGGPPGTPEEDGDRYVEIWNLVFMQFDRAADGSMKPLPKPCVDTGMGLERLAAVLQGVQSNYEIDLFQHLLRAAAERTRTNDLDHPSLKVIADHIRACAFMIADGVLPSNEGRGYVLRRIIRRAIRHGYKLGQNQPFFAVMVDPLVEAMGEAYPELVKRRDSIVDALAREEQRFGETLDQGMKLLDERVLFERMLQWAKQEFGDLSVGPNRLDSLNGEFLRFSGSFREGNKRTSVECCAVLRESHAIMQLKNRLRFLQNTQHFLFVSEAIGDPQFNEKANALMVEYPDIQVDCLRESDLPRFISGDLAFMLYDTYGFPIDLTRDIARERSLTVDETGFEQSMQAQREKARASGKFVLQDEVSADLVSDLPATEFIGYDAPDIANARIVAIMRDGHSVECLSAGESATILLDRTPFYAESGGQVGDTGRLSSGNSQFEVHDTRKVAGVYHGHQGQLINGELSVGDLIAGQIDEQRRIDTVRHHSATHLMHAALRDLLGEHVEQKGSLVAPDRLRFDFTHFEPVSDEQIRAIETRVNDQIQANAASSANEMAFDDAIEAGALAFFGDKYGDRVRVLQFGDYSTELCGGTHVDRVGDIGLFKIVSETGISAGVRRIEAVAGRYAVSWVQQMDESLRRVAGRLKASPEQLSERVEMLLERSRALEKELERLKSKLASAQGSDLSSAAEQIEGVNVIRRQLDGIDPNSLRDTVDQLKNKLGSGVIVLATTVDDRIRLVAGVTQDLTNRFKAGELINHVASQVGGKGGGRPDFAQAGGSDSSQLQRALDSVDSWVRERL
ncbi:MAG: alanine--tRNA ligase [Pseudomonadota bacterium]